MLTRLFTLRKIFVFLFAISATTLLGACGGGGGGGEEWNYTPPTGTAPTTPIAIDTTSSLDIASEAYTSFAASQSGTAFTPSQSGAATSPTVSGVQTTSSVSLLDVTRKVLEIHNPREPQVVSGATVGCDLGSITYPDSGLGVYRFNSCNLGGIVLDGQIRFSGTATATSFNGSLIYNAFTVSDGVTELLSIHGQINIVESYDDITGDLSGTYSGELLAITFGTEVIDLTNFNFTYTINLTTGNGAVSVNYTVNSTLLTGSVTVTTINPLLYYSGFDHPYEGQILISGAGDSKVRLTVNPGGTGSIFDFVTIETDADDGDDIYESSTVVDWATLTS